MNFNKIVEVEKTATNDRVKKCKCSFHEFSLIFIRRWNDCLFRYHRFALKVRWIDQILFNENKTFVFSLEVTYR